MLIAKTGILAVALLGVSAAGYSWLFCNRIELMPGVVADYDTLYWHEGLPRITGFGFDGRVVDVEFRGRGRAGFERETHSFELEPGLNDREVLLESIRYEPPISLRFQVVGGVVYFRNSSVPVEEDEDSLPLEHWTRGYWEASSKASVDAAREQLAALGLAACDSTLERMEILEAFLHEKIQPHTVTAGDVISDLPGIEMFEAVCAGKVVVECGQIARIWTAFANLAGIQTRIVDAIRYLGDARLVAHTFCESYIPEQDRWAFVDPSANETYFMDPQGRVMNTWQLFEAWLDDDLDRLRVVPDPTRPVDLSDLFHRQGRFLFTTAIHHSSSSLTRMLAYFFQPKLVACLNPNKILRISRLRTGLTVGGVLGLVLLLFSWLRPPSGEQGATCRGRRPVGEDSVLVARKEGEDG